jgi:hypothetical protein
MEPLGCFYAVEGRLDAFLPMAYVAWTGSAPILPTPEPLRRFIMRILTLPVVLLVMLSACRKEDSSQLPDNTPIHQDYKVLFDKPENRTRAFATFRKNNAWGTRLQLTGGSGITFNGSGYTTYTELDNYFYRWSTNGMSSVVFRFTKEGVGDLLNGISLSDTIDVAVPGGISVSIPNGAQVFWIGHPLQAGESVVAQLRQGSTSTSKVTVTTVGAQSVVIPSSVLSTLSPGTAELYLTRSRTLGIQQADGSAGGRRIVEVEARGTIAVQ